MLGIEALNFSLIAFENITDYNTNHAFVKGVMPTGRTFHGEDNMWRAITSVATYFGIIAWESATAFVCWTATMLAGRSPRPSTSFELPYSSC